jgi:hypothetical protein
VRRVFLVVDFVVNFCVGSTFFVLVFVVVVVLSARADVVDGFVVEIFLRIVVLGGFVVVVVVLVFCKRVVVVDDFVVKIFF